MRISIAERAVPDLVLLDVMMPEMDGFETCARLKADARTSEVAVIFLSALAEASDRVRGLELGAVDFVNKPFQAEEVLARVRTHLTIRDLQKQLRKRNEQLEHELIGGPGAASRGERPHRRSAARRQRHAVRLRDDSRKRQRPICR